MTILRRIAVADGHPLVRTGVRVTLQANEDYQLVCEASDAERAFEQVRELQPDLLISELEMRGRPTDQLVVDCKEVCPHLKILILSARTDDKYLAPLRGIGVTGFVLKNEAPEMLLQALRVIEQGSTWFSHAVIRQVLLLSGSERNSAFNRLTPREREIYSLMMLGQDNCAIAGQLRVAKQTIRRNITVIYEKLGVANRIEAIVAHRDWGRNCVGGRNALTKQRRAPSSQV